VKALIVFDLEWNNGLYDSITLNEVLQISAVRMDPHSGKITNTFCVFIHPEVHKRYSPPVEGLPELASCEASRLDFKTAVNDFIQWCGEETEFGTWGCSDMSVLRSNANYWGLSLPLPKQFYDLQEAFGLLLGTNSAISLQRAVEYCGFPETFEYHNSLHDALYTACVSACVSSECLENAVHILGQKRKKHKKPPTPRLGQYGPFGGRREMLNDRGCRLAVCPKCGQKTRISHWHGKGEGPYYAKCKCPEHGALVLKLTTVLPENRSQWWANTEVLESDPEIKLLLNKTAGFFPCHSAKKSTRKRKKRRFYSPALTKDQQQQKETPSEGADT